MNSWQSGEVIAVRRKKCSGASSRPTTQYSGRRILALFYTQAQSQKYPWWHLIHWGGDLVQCGTEICGDIAYVYRLYIDSFETHSKLASHKLTFNTHKKAGLGEGRQQRNWSALFIFYLNLMTLSWHGIKRGHDITIWLICNLNIWNTIHYPTIHTAGLIGSHPLKF